MEKNASINKELDSITFYRIKDIPLALYYLKTLVSKMCKSWTTLTENQLQIRLKEKDKEVKIL